MLFTIFVKQIAHLFVVDITNLLDKFASDFDGATPLSELESIGLQIQKDLLEAPLVCAHDQLLLTWWLHLIIAEVFKFVIEIYSLELGLFLLNLHYLFDGFLDTEVESILPKVAELELRKVQNIVDQEVQNFGRGHIDVD